MAGSPAQTARTRARLQSAAVSQPLSSRAVSPSPRLITLSTCHPPSHPLATPPTVGESAHQR
eukprot:11126758-Alexandrium_andersonii.AAC.1